MHKESPKHILRDLVGTYGHTHKSLQFATYISAYQYLKLYHLLTQYVSVGSQVLDWGTGSGHFSYFLNQAGYQASGFGFSEWPLFCQGLDANAYQYQQGSPANPVELPFSTGSFDAVVSVGVLEHVRETGGQETASLAEIHRILKPGGIFICYHFPNKYSWIEFLARFTSRFSHPYLFTRSDIHGLTEATSFELLAMGRYAFLPRNFWQSPLLRHPRWGPTMAIAYGHIDQALGWLFSPICQNYFFVARKP